MIPSVTALAIQILRYVVWNKLLRSSGIRARIARLYFSLEGGAWAVLVTRCSWGALPELARTCSGLPSLRF